jgi:hypothetical protein
MCSLIIGISRAHHRFSALRSSLGTQNHRCSRTNIIGRSIHLERTVIIGCGKRALCTNIIGPENSSNRTDIIGIPGSRLLGEVCVKFVLSSILRRRLILLTSLELGGAILKMRLI